MAEAQPIILHHYPMSPFAEKIRLILGAKGVRWSSVLIPVIMPKPDVVALTGGYRKTPILQIGADVYCDTALIADVIETLAPQPTLYPRGVAGASRTLAQWADSTLFWTAIPHTMQSAGLAHVFNGAPAEVIQAFAEDRKVFRANLPRMRAPEAWAGLELYLERLEDMIGGQAFFFGAQPSIADFSVYHCLWFVSRGGPQAEILKPYRELGAWCERMRGFGHGVHDQLDSAAAIAIAETSTPLPSSGISGDVHGIPAGEKVVIAATDTGIDPIEGELYGETRERISIARTDRRAGRVVVHFPRLGFELRRLM
ncbi:MAG TPA: glutathione S-transferase family protein [Steroidobacteraceae bacterium]|nr:glutathione S-transferase family protein [Steroidobacteraceae bacterium]